MIYFFGGDVDTNVTSAMVAQSEVRLSHNVHLLSPKPCNKMHNSKTGQSGANVKKQTKKSFRRPATVCIYAQVQNKKKDLSY